MKITKDQAIRQDWDEVKSWNYKIGNVSPKMSVVYAELEGDHGEVVSKEFERIYYILEGVGEFVIDCQKVSVNKEDVITIPPNTTYDYRPLENSKMKVLLFMELWDN